MLKNNQKKFFFQPTVILVLICLLYLVFITHKITLPWLGGHLGLNGKWVSLQTKNYLRYGYWNTKFGPTINYGSNIPQEFLYYVNHPMLLSIVISLFLKIFGVTEWAARLAPITFSMACLVFVFYFVRNIWGVTAGLFSAFFWAIFPMTTYYAQNLEYSPQNCFFIMLSVYLYWEWVTSGKRKYLWFLFPIYLLAMLTDWPAFFLAFLLAIHYILWHRKPKSYFTFPIIFFLYSVLIFGLYCVYHYQITGNFLPTHSHMHDGTVMGYSFSWEEFFGLMRMRMLVYYTIPACLLAFVWLMSALKKMFSKKLSSQEGLILSFFFLAALYSFVFRDGAWHHPFWIYYFAPFIAMASGVLLGEIWHELKNTSISRSRVNIIIGVICFSSAIGGVITFREMRAKYLHNKEVWSENKFSLELAQNIPEGQPFIFVTRNKSQVIYNTSFYYTDRPLTIVYDQEELERALNSQPNTSYVLVNKVLPEADYIKERFKEWKLLGKRILAHR